MLLLLMLFVELSDGLIFDLAECSLLMEVLTLVNVVVVSTLLIASVTRCAKHEQTFGQLRVAITNSAPTLFSSRILKSPIFINAP